MVRRSLQPRRRNQRPRRAPLRRPRRRAVRPLETAQRSIQFSGQRALSRSAQTRAELLAGPLRGGPALSRKNSTRPTPPANSKPALALNPQAAEVHAAIASMAVGKLRSGRGRKRRSSGRWKSIPGCCGPISFKPMSHLANFESAQAIEALQAASSSIRRTNRRSAGSRPPMPASMDPPTRKQQAASRLGRLIAEVTARNPHCGEFYAALAAGLDRLQRYPDAVDFYREAIDRMPQLVGPRGELGLVYMRLGEEVAADKVLHEAFAIDPFNVRVSNTLQVLEVLSNYSVIETRAFRRQIRSGSRRNAGPLRREISGRRSLSAAGEKARLSAAGKIAVRDFQPRRNTDGHGWFSAAWSGCRISARSELAPGGWWPCNRRTIRRRNSIGPACCGMSSCMS